MPETKVDCLVWKYEIERSKKLLEDFGSNLDLFSKGKKDFGSLVFNRADSLKMFIKILYGNWEKTLTNTVDNSRSVGQAGLDFNIRKKILFEGTIYQMGDILRYSDDVLDSGIADTDAEHIRMKLIGFQVGTDSFVLEVKLPNGSITIDVYPLEDLKEEGLII